MGPASSTRSSRIPRGGLFLVIIAIISGVVLDRIYLELFSSTASSDSDNNNTKASSSSEEESNGHIVVIDAGSSGSRAHVFRYYDGHKIDPKHESFKAKPGLSSYASHPDDAGSSMDSLLDFARQHVPADQVSRTRIVLKATAGMRLLETEEQRTAILHSVSERLGASGFSFSPKDAQVIDGKEEGMLGWLSVNYLNEHTADSNNKKSDQWGVLEMGGASVQFTMPLPSSASAAVVPNEHKLTYRVAAAKKQETHQVFTHSFLGLGMESARKAVNDALTASGATADPCLPASYVEEHDANEFSGVASIASGGDFDACSQLVKSALFPSRAECTHPTGCFYNGMYAPAEALKTGKFWAFENFFYTPSALGIHGLPGRMAVKDLIDAGKAVCAMNWKQVDTDYPKDNQPKDNNEKWCFGAAYMHMLFTEGFGFPPDQEITVGNSVGSNGIDWALGAALQAVLEEASSSGGLLRGSQQS